jgi:hypothetical protein
MVTPNPFLPPHPAQLVAERSMEINPLLSRPSAFTEGRMTPTSQVRETQVQKDIQNVLEDQAKETRRVARKNRSSAWFDLGLSALSAVFLGPGASLLMSGARRAGLGPQSESLDLSEEQEEMEALTGLLKESEHMPMQRGTYLQRIGEQYISSGERDVARANEYAADAAKTTGLINLGNTLVSLAKTVSGAIDSARTPMPVPGQEAAVAEQVAAGLKPGPDLMTTPAKEFLQTMGVENERLNELAVEGLSKATADAPHPGIWGSTGVVDEAAGNMIDPLYPDRYIVHGQTVDAGDLMIPPPSKAPMFYDHAAKKWTELPPVEDPLVPQPMATLPSEQMKIKEAMKGSNPDFYRGTVDLSTKGPVRIEGVEDGSSYHYDATVRSYSHRKPNGEIVLIPTVIKGRVVSVPEAIRHYNRTGQHLGGGFKDHGQAGAYAERLSQAEGARLQREKHWSR